MGWTETMRWPDEREFLQWAEMRLLCRDSRSGRRVRMHRPWRDFDTFLEDMGPAPSNWHVLERIDPDGDFTPENCRWTKPRGRRAASERLTESFS